MILIDTNALVLLLIGLMDTRIINHHKRTSIYEEQDFIDLLGVIGELDKLIVLPNVWTEVDNLLNGFSGRQKDSYVKHIIQTIQNTTEKFIKTIKATQSVGFYELGVTDSLLLEYAKECNLLITADSRLSDYAQALNIKVYDIIKHRNDHL